MLLIALLSAFLSQIAWGQGYITVVDSSDMSPVEGATVISNNGLILGITDKMGKIAVNPKKDFPIEIRNLGFESVTISQPSDTVALIPATYSLSEITVKPGDRPIAKAICYAREYCSGATSTDTLQLYADYMLVSYLAEEKVKGYKSSDRNPSPRAVRRVARISDSKGLDSISTPGKDDDINFLSFRDVLPNLPSGVVVEPDAFKTGAVADTVMGKFSPKNIYKKTDNLFTITIDGLGDYENHRWSPLLFKLIGMTIEMDKLQGAYAYNLTSNGRYGLNDFIYSTGALHGLAKGKMFKLFLHNKSELDLDCYTEFYPVDIEFLTVEEYKEDRKEKTPIPFKTPKNLQPLPPAVIRMIGRVAINRN